MIIFKTSKTNLRRFHYPFSGYSGYPFLKEEENPIHIGSLSLNYVTGPDRIFVITFTKRVVSNGNLNTCYTLEAGT